MNINKVGYIDYSKDAYNQTNKTNTSENSSDTEEVSVIYEKSSKTESTSALQTQLKANQDALDDRYKTMVQNMLSEQNAAIQKYNTTLDEILSGEKSLQEAAEEAAAEISEDGYWGVEQTSERIFSFAIALSGGDSSKMDELLDAFKQGFDEATEAWGDTLPDICQDTYDAVLQKFEDYENNN